MQLTQSRTTYHVCYNTSHLYASLRFTVGVLIIFAIVASAAVLHKGLHDENRNKFRLALHCIMILTSVVPPELPMELSLAGEME